MSAMKALDFAMEVNLDVVDLLQTEQAKEAIQVCNDGCVRFAELYQGECARRAEEEPLPVVVALRHDGYEEVHWIPPSSAACDIDEAFRCESQQGG